MYIFLQNLRILKTCTGVSFVSDSDTKLTPVHKTTHPLLRTSATTPSAEHHMD